MNRDIVEQIIHAVESKRDDIIGFTKILVKQLSENPPGGEQFVGELIINKASEWGLPAPEVWSIKEEHPNLIFTVNGQKQGRTLLLNGHTDTKPIGDITAWSTDPYEPEIINGKLYGRGATDMKGSVVGMLGAAYALIHSKILINGNLVLALTADEEAGSVYGAKALVKDRGIQADAVIVGEPSGTNKGFDTIHIACRGALLGKVVVHGTQMHSSLSDKGGCINASVKMAQVLCEFAANLKSNLRYEPHYLYPTGPTVNPGVLLSGGIFYGVIPGEASFGFDIRVIPGMTLERIKSDIEGFLERLMKRDRDLKAELVLEKPPMDWHPPVEIGKDHPLVTSCLYATKEIIGEEPIIEGALFGTDAISFSGVLGIPTIPSFGPGFIKLAHGPDEFIEVEDIINAAKIYALAAAEYLNEPGI
jgi:acetylornithine deacetylase/succinyl-diaminopimelate desuccinylase family protein